MKYAQVLVEVAVDEGADAAAVVESLIDTALNRGYGDDVGLGDIHVVAEKPIAVDEDGTPDWASVRPPVNRRA